MERQVIELSAEAMTAWGTIGLAVLTAVLAAYTALLYRETRRVRLERLEPNIIVNIEPNQIFGFFDLVVENLGPGSAHDLKITPPADMKVKDDQVNFDRSPLYSIKFMKTGTSLRTFLGRIDDISPHELKFAIAFANAKGQQRTNELTINIDHYRALSALGDTNPLQSICNALKKIEDHLGRLGSGWSRIKVETYNTEDRRQEADAQEARLKAGREQTIMRDAYC